MSRADRFVIATNNKKKLSELAAILESLGIEAVGMEQAGAAVFPEETGATFEENAEIKAAEVCKATGLASIADDSGLEVDALSGAPGVYTARYGGEGLTDEERYTHLLDNLKGVPEEKRTAKFVSAVCAVFPDGRRATVRGECRGRILEKPAGTGGFGYDPVFFSDEAGAPFALLRQEEKNEVSHRGKALEKLKAELAGMLEKEI